VNKKAFENLLKDKKILWNDMVKITIINPYKKRWEFWKENHLSFEGALGYKKGDNIVNLCINDPNDNFKSIFVYFDFEQIIGIEKMKKY
jgi:hypothetical protein